MNGGILDNGNKTKCMARVQSITQYMNASLQECLTTIVYSKAIVEKSIKMAHFIRER